MPPPDSSNPPDRQASLWLLTLAPAIWMAHFLVSYLSASIWCQKLAGPSGDLGPVRLGIGALTLLAVAGIIATGWRGLRLCRATGGPPAQRDAAAEDRNGFIGYATLLLACLSVAATLFVALVFVFIKNCD